MSAPATVPRLSSAQILQALVRAYPRAAFVHELSIACGDHAGYERYEAGEAPAPTMTRRIDALMFSGPQRTAIEIKVSAADAKRESYGKVEPWRRVTHRFVYAVPAGLLEHPPVYGCGLWWIHENGNVEVRRKARVNTYAEELPRYVVTNLAYRAAGASRITPAEPTDPCP